MAIKILSVVPHKTNNQELNDQATLIYSVGGIDITTNLNTKQSKDYPIPTFSDFYSLDNVESNDSIINQTNLTPNTKMVLNLDYSNPFYFAKFGSLLERVRVALENIILQYPAAIYSKNILLKQKGNNVLNVAYFPFDDSSTMDLNVSYFSNPLDVYYLDNNQYKFDDSRTNPLRNLSNNFVKYSLYYNGSYYPILEYLPAKKTSNDFIKLRVKGKPFPIGNNSLNFYLTPNSVAVDESYSLLDDFESYLLNRNTNFAAFFQKKQYTDDGRDVSYLLKLQFPKEDDFNIDIRTQNYEVYFNDLIDFAQNWDLYYGNALARKYLPSNVQSLTIESNDTTIDDENNFYFPAAEKLSQLFVTYGRMWDDLSCKIESVKFFNTVTYDKKDNVADNLLKNLASTMGWDFINGFNFDSQVWRLLILNTPFVWSSKGTRASIEWLLSFLGIPKDIVDFNEYIVSSNKTLDYNQLKNYYQLIDKSFDLKNLSVDSNGYPLIPKSNDEFYFQMKGESDDGQSYFAKWLNFFPAGFTGTQITYTQENIQSNLLFEQDFDGSGNTLSVSSVNKNIFDVGCFDVSGDTVSDPQPEIFLDDCGCPLPISDKTLYYCASPKPLYTGCTNIVLDVWYECFDISAATLHINALGGYPPYTISGATNLQTVYSGETLNIIAVDSSGCTSNVVSFTVNCIDPCLAVDIFVGISYVCIQDEFGQNTGEATLVIDVSGGTAPYTFIGANSGDTVNDGQIVQVEVIDSNGCSSGVVGKLIDCPLPDIVPCGDIILRSSLETTNVELAQKTAKVNVVYDIEGLPFGVYVSGVTVTSAGVDVVGSPVSEDFTTIVGADTLLLDFDPSDIPVTTTINITITILLTNGCIYQDTYNLTVNPRQLGSVDTHNTILTPIP